MPKSIWPGVKAKKAKGRLYWYWARSKPYVRLPDPYTETDAFMRKIAYLGRVSAAADQARRTGTFGAIAASFRGSPGYAKLSANTRRSYNRYLDRLIVAYGDAPIREIEREDVQVRVMDANADTPGAANMMLAVMGAVYKYADRRVKDLTDPTEKITAYRAAGEHEPWPPTMLQAALESEDVHFRTAVALHYFTGQRTGDTCKMAWNAVGADGITVRQDKTKEPLTIDIHPDLAPVLAAMPRKAIVLLTNKRGAPLTPGTFYKWCVDFSATYGLRRTPHGLRKNAVNALFEAGCSAPEVMAVSGHRSLKMLEHYGKRRNQPLINRAAMAKWGASSKREREN